MPLVHEGIDRMGEPLGTPYSMNRPAGQPSESKQPKAVSVRCRNPTRLLKKGLLGIGVASG
jgi:hypothetical protein